MSNIEPFPLNALAVVPVANVSQTAWSAAVDPQAIAQLFDGLPATEAEDRLCRILEALALWLQATVDAHADGRVSSMVEPARRIASAAEQIGLREVVCAANHVLNCLRQSDATALAAVMGRLERAFDLAVTSIWDIVAF